MHSYCSSRLHTFVGKTPRDVDSLRHRSTYAETLPPRRTEPTNSYGTELRVFGWALGISTELGMNLTECVSVLAKVSNIIEVLPWYRHWWKVPPLCIQATSLYQMRYEVDRQMGKYWPTTSVSFLSMLLWQICQTLAHQHTMPPKNVEEIQYYVLFLAIWKYISWCF